MRCREAGQSRMLPFLGAAALFAALTITAHSLVLGLAAIIAGPVPAAQTALSLSRKAVASGTQEAASAAEAAPESAVSAPSQPEAAAPTGGIEGYLVELLGEDARPENAGAVLEKNYPQGSGGKYVPCGAGSIKNNTRQSVADIAAEIENLLPFLGAAALFAALTIMAHSVVLGLAAVIAGPVPAAQTALSLSRKAVSGAAQEEAASVAEAAPESTGTAASQPEAAAPTGGIESYLVELLGDDARPEGAGAVIEKNYPQGSGEKYVACGAGSIKNNTRQTAADIAAEIQDPLPFGVEKDSPDPQILIMHTHATEDYRLSAGLWYSPGDGARTTDTNLNMCAVGRVMADTLNAAGLNTLHDETLNDYPSYTGSYANSRAVVQRYLAQYPSIKVVLDVHRDAIETEGGSRMAPVCTVDGRQAAQVMIICGCDNGGSVQLPDWRQNLRFAAAWERSMEGMYPGFTRPVLFSYRFYNQDLTTGSLLIEIGGHGNNLNEALYAGQLAANGLVQALLGPDA